MSISIFNKYSQASYTCVGTVQSNRLENTRWASLITIFHPLTVRIFGKLPIIHNILEFLMKAMGFMADGTINYIFPTITLFILLAILGSGAYAIIRRTELK